MIGRALLAPPKIPLVDGPLASLDAERKLEIMPLIELLRDEFRIPIVYVSHAVEEVARLGAHIFMLERGQVSASGAVEDVLGLEPAQIGESRFARTSVVVGRISGIDEHYGLTEITRLAGTICLAIRTGPVRREVRVAGNEPAAACGDFGATTIRATRSGGDDGFSEHPVDVRPRIRFTHLRKGYGYDRAVDCRD